MLKDLLENFDLSGTKSHIVYFIVSSMDIVTYF
jgi:hypothetical protein